MKMKEITISQAIELLKNGEVAILPTDTIYGICGDATSEGVAKKIYELKKRPESKKFVVLAPNLNIAKKYFQIPEKAAYFIRAFAGKKVSIVIPNQSKYPWVGAIRIPKTQPIGEILNRFGKPIVATSANISGERHLVSPEEISKLFDLPVLSVGNLAAEPSAVYDPLRGKTLRGTLENVAAAEVLWKAHTFQKKFIKKHLDGIREKGEEILEKVRKYHRNSFLGGSVSKGTIVDENPDIDIFLLYPKNTDLEEVLPRLIEIAKSIGEEIELRYSQHPYVRVKTDGFWVELVPAYDVPPSEARSAADRSVWHVKFVRENFDEFLLVEAGVLKRFLKASELYGSDLKHQSISGYACEVLVYKYGSTLSVMEEIVKWLLPPFIPDPVDSRRNVIASLHRETLLKIQNAIRKFLLDPEFSYFKRKDVRPPEEPFWKEGTFIAIYDRENLPEDAAYGRGWRIFRKIRKNAMFFGFKVLNGSIFVSDDRIFLIFVVFPGMRRERLILGPPTGIEQKHIEKFREKHDLVFVLGRRLMGIDKRVVRFTDVVEKFSSPSKLLKIIQPEEIALSWNSFSEGLRKEFIKTILRVVDDSTQR